ncbi:PREDICTED: testis-expressed sequence 10 protein homolog isoform X2 [Nelumbo nucifera]|uniref:Testis-expressed sequence 10 protein homolog isoform X2 n=1 Tax=Nelumbo nucifera TaxID=4432 RepID=A0A1U8Q8H7_NELNU|nr:PREDICTED: testis-expressed sequence 10 protein homolog isoform X2 [Nelumbo nucifera]
MARSKPSSSKKQPKRGVDFKKIKRKIGRKLPPPKNATNTEIKSKAIILPEQSVASERAGLAVSKKGLTLKELLQQTSHHNAKVRRDALTGIRDLVLKYPAELTLHKLAIIEKLRERISDEDKVVRETLYQLLKLVIFPALKKDVPGSLISLMMAYIFNGMTHLATDIRLMAFKFFDLVVQHYPSSFFMYAEKVLQNYEDILRKNHIYLQDRSKLKNALVGLVRCLSLLPCNRRTVDPSYGKNTETQGSLHAYELEVPKEHTDFSSIIKRLEDILPILVNCFQDFIPLVHPMSSLDAQSFDCMLYLLRSIDLSVKFFLYGIDKHQTDFGVTKPTYNEKDMPVWGEIATPVFLRKFLEVFPLNQLHNTSGKDEDKFFILNIEITEIFLHSNEWIFTSAILMERFLEFIENLLSGKIRFNSRSGKALQEKHLTSLLPFIPRLVSLVANTWKSRLLQAFTMAFKDCKPESTLNLAFLSAIEEMLLPSKRQGILLLDASEPEILDHQITWIRELPVLLVRLGDTLSSLSKVILHLLLRLGQYAPMNSSLAWEYDIMQHTLGEFYSMCLDDGSILYGPFMKLPKDCQELSVCCLYYFSSLDSLLLRSLVYCCLCDNLEPSVLFRIIDVLHSAYKIGHLQLVDLISFFVTLVARWKVLPGRLYTHVENAKKISNRETFKAITGAVCSCLRQMGDDALIFQIVQRVILDEIPLNPPIDNLCGMLRLLVILDSRPTKLSEQSIIILSNSISEYLIDAASYIPENGDEVTDSNQISICQYYLVPCFFLFDRSDKLLNLVLDLMGSSIGEDNSSLACNHDTQHTLDLSSRIVAVVSILLYMHQDIKIRRRLSSCKGEITRILQKMRLQSSNEMGNTLEERHKIQFSFDRLKIAAGQLNCWDADELKIISLFE